MKRTEVEQENRHQLLHKLVDNDHSLSATKLKEMGKDARYVQTLGAVVLIVIILIAACLLAIGKEIQALACILLVVGPPIVMVISQKIFKRADHPVDVDDPKNPAAGG